MIKIIIKDGSLDNVIITILVNVQPAENRVFFASHEKECGIITTSKGFFSALKMYTY